MKLSRTNASEAETRTFRANGWIIIPSLIPVDTVASIRTEIESQDLHLRTSGRCLIAKNPYLRAFDKITNLWRLAASVRAFHFESGIAQVAASLLGVNGVRLSHDQSLFKPPGASATPVHADQYHWPVSSENTVTAWIPLQNTPTNMGAIQYFQGSHLLNEMKREEICAQSTEEAFLRTSAFPRITPSFEIGDIGFHYGWTFHGASPNGSSQARGVLTIVMMEDGVKIEKTRPDFPDVMLGNWCPGQTYGDVLRSELNPLLWSADTPT